jgi:adenylate kinase
VVDAASVAALLVNSTSGYKHGICALLIEAIHPIFFVLMEVSVERIFAAPSQLRCLRLG